MPKLTFITANGQTLDVDHAEGSLMTAAVSHQVPGILGDCGGVGACATCHVQIDPAWSEKVGPASDAELGMLELEDSFTEYSRLGCQVKLHAELDGLVVRVVGQAT